MYNVDTWTNFNIQQFSIIPKIEMEITKIIEKYSVWVS